MKNAMKKLTSLLLVAVLLVGMIPFAASATEAATIVLKINGEVVATVTGSFEKSPTTFALLEQYNKVDLSAVAGATFSHTWKAGMGGNTAGKEIEINPGDEIHVAYTMEVNERCYLCGGIVVSGSVHCQTCDKCGNQWCGSHECAPAQPVVPEVKPITVVVKVDNSDNIVVNPFTKVPANGEYALVEDLLTYCWNSGWDGVYTFSHAWSKTNNEITKNSDAKIYAGDEVHIMLKTNATNSDSNNSGSNNNDYIVDEEFQHDIWLYIYTNNDLIQPSKRVLLNNYAIVDGSQDGGILTKNEILSVVDDYYKATDANKGILWQGAYSEDTLDIIKFVAKNDEAPFTGLAAKRTAGTVVIKVRVTGVTTVGTTYTADSSNPKTGDSIYTAMTVMGISAAALASVMYFYNKKRMAM